MNKSDTRAFVNQMLVSTLFLICVSGAIGLSTVWMRQQMAQTANSIKRIESSTLELERRLAETTSLVASEQAPENLRRRNEQLNLGLVQPKEQQVVRLDVRPEQRLAAKRNSEIFSPVPTLDSVRLLTTDAR